MFAVSSGPHKLSQPALRGMHIRAFVHAAFIPYPFRIPSALDRLFPKERRQGGFFCAHARKARRNPEDQSLPALAARAGMR